MQGMLWFVIIFAGGDDILVFTFIKLKGLFLTKLYLHFCLMAALGIEMLTFCCSTLL
jgi:hypothetical protein